MKRPTRTLNFCCVKFVYIRPFPSSKSYKITTLQKLYSASVVRKIRTETPVLGPCLSYSQNQDLVEVEFNVRNVLIAYVLYDGQNPEEQFNTM